ncbi:hypothetical protein [Halomonas sp. BN3-1]|uniref:DUF5801 repeats-in-toxin domain-containing protein n=1 Tax=Halomonas sp. BN3-1 TaxID=2082393 RepID=UPI000D359B2B|nr:hypothetical protein [Halomonas sp. BN3-1]
MEEITPLKYQFGPLPPDEVLPRAGGANSHDGDLQDDRLAGAPDDIPTTPDSDGDPATLTPQGLLDEDGLPKGIAGGPGDAPGTEVVITGCLDYDFGDDGPAASGAFSWTTEGLPILTSQGEMISWTVSDDGLTLSGVDESGEPVLTVTVTDPASGEYEAELHQGLDHSDPTTEDDIVLTLGYEVTDGDGDTAKGSLVLTVDDDMPTVTIEGPEARNEDGSLSGTWVQDGGGDEQAEIVVTLPGDDTKYPLDTPIDTDGGTLVVKPDNTWTFTPDEPGDGSPAKVPGFEITITDGDGDSTTASYPPATDDTPTTPDSDGDPATLTPQGLLDEDGLPKGIAGGPGDAPGTEVVITGCLDYDFGDDGPAASGAFSWTTEGLPVLTSQGETVSWTVSDDGLTLSGVDESGEPVLTVSVTDPANGEYEAELHQGLDHSDPTTEDDIVLTLGYEVTDGDGDTAKGSLVLTVDDDMPTVTIEGPEAPNEDGSLSGTWVQDGGGDEQAEIVVTLPGDDTEYPLDTPIDTDGGTLVVKPDNTWTFTPDEPGDGSPAKVPGFEITITDGDGDSTTASYPPAPDDIPTTPDSDGDPATLAPQGLLDEDGLPKGIAGGPGDAPGTEVVITGCLDYDFGDDGPAASGAFSWTTEGLPILTSQGEMISWTVSDDGLTLSGVDESGEPVLTVTVTDPASGEYEAELHQGLDHSDPITEDDIVLTLGYEVTDGDGDTAKGSLVLTVDDDMPTVTIEGPEAPNEDGSLSGTWVQDGGGDEQAEIVVTLPGDDTEYPLDTPIDTDGGTLVVKPDNTWTFTPDEPGDGSPAKPPGFEITITDGDGDSTTASYPPATDDTPTTPDSDGDPATLTPQGLLDEDGLPKGIAGGPGDAPGTEVVITGCLDYDFGDDGPAASGAFSWTTDGLPILTSQGEMISWTVSDDGLTLSGVDESGEPVLTVTVTDPANGEYEAELHQGLDHSDPTTEDDIVLTLGYEVTDGDGDTAKGSLVLTVDDDRPVIEATVDDDAASMVEGGTQGGSWSGGVGADEGNVVIRIPGVTDAFALGEEIATGTGTLVVAPDGTWSFTAKEGLDQSQDPCLEFTIEGIDSEGDSARSSIKVVITDGAGPATPDSDGDPSTESVSVAVNEDGLPTGNAGGEGDLESSSDSASANLGFDYGADGAAEQGAFRWELDGLPELTSRDSPVEFVVSSDGYTVMGNDADGERVLTINLADAETGDVVVYLSKDVDHPEGGQENDLALELGYTITDKDGSTASGTLEVVINDDTPTITGIDPESFMAAMGGATRAAALPLLAEEDELAWNLGEPASSADISHATAVDASGNMLDLRELLEDIDDLEGGEKVLAIADGDDTVVHVKLDGGLLQDGSNADVQVTLTGVSMDGSSDDFLVKLLESSQSDIE